MAESQSISSEEQIESLNVIALVLMIAGYIWLVLVLYPFAVDHHPASAWVGSLSLISLTGASFFLRNRSPRLASSLILSGVFVAVAAATLAYRRPELAYLFILPVILSGIFIRRIITLFLIGLVIAGIFIVRYWLSLPLMSLDTYLQVVITTTAGLTSWLSASRLYHALTWAKNNYEQARMNEQIVREQQADMVRTLKAVDKLTYQVERANRTLMIERDLAEEARRLKQQFAQNISHELRTPLSLIVGFSQMMLESPEYYGTALPRLYVRDLSTIHRNANHLLSLTNDVLELAGIDAGQLNLAVERLDPAELAQDVANTAASLIQQKGLKFQLVTEPGLPQLWGDPARIRQVLFNLLNNAARYTDQGKVTLSVSTDSENIIFSVKDTGIGIPEDKLSQIFEEFLQLSVDGKKRGGTGLGLAISQRFISMHGGKIWVESELAKGSTFYVSIPIFAKNQLLPFSAKPTQPISDEQINVKQDRIVLVATKNPGYIAWLNRHLTGGRCLMVKEQQQIKAVYDSVRPQAIMIDSSMDMNNNGASLPAEVDGIQAPIIACALSGERHKVEELGIDSYLSKPVSREHILDILRHFGEEIDSALIADDDRDFLQFMSRVLDNPVRKYQVTTAHNRVELITMMQHQPDLVFIGLDLSRIELAALVDEIHLHQTTSKRVRVVVIAQDDNLIGNSPIIAPVTISKKKGLMPSTVARIVQEVMEREGE